MRRPRNTFQTKEPDKASEKNKLNETEISNLSDKAFSDGHKNAHKSQKNGVTQGELQQIENIKEQ